MKKINNYVSAGLCLTALLLLSLTASTPCMAGESNSVELGFCDTTGAGIKTMSADSEGVYSGGSAIYFPASDIASFAGAEITEIKIKLDGEPTSLKMFVAKSLNGTYDYEQELTGGVEGWNTFTLDTPFAIDGTDLYVGYEETG
ncbi:MAG: hypothetical protein LUC22_02560, partial [Prevotella sp.]|nr:hypothetical protein [Prevotella sp.]